MKRYRIKSIFSIFLIFVLSLVLISCQEPEDEDKKYTVEDLDTKVTDELKLTTPFEGKRFLAEGIEEVELLRLVDGDTTHFISGKDTIKLRYIGINTPESTSRIDPWGKQASVFVQNKLENAYSIIIEAEDVGIPAPSDATGDRFLGYVWYKTNENDDYRLLNLEVIENCFSFFTGDPLSLKYGSQMNKALSEKRPMKLRVFGEKDPNFDYDLTIHKISIHELRSNYSSFSTGSKLKVEVRVVRLVGNSLYVEDIEDSYDDETGKTGRSGMFVYHSFTAGIGRLKPGQVVEFDCQASDPDAFGMQLVSPSNISILEEDSDYTIQEIDKSITNLKDYEGFVVKIKNFTVTEVYTNKNPEDLAYTIYGTMENGALIQVRIDGDVSSPLLMSSVKVGSKYDVIGGVSKFVDAYDNGKIHYQLKLGNLKHDGIGDFKIVNTSNEGDN